MDKVHIVLIILCLINLIFTIALLNKNPQENAKPLVKKSKANL
jgi:hypothetical protein